MSQSRPSVAERIKETFEKLDFAATYQFGSNQQLTSKTFETDVTGLRMHRKIYKKHFDAFIEKFGNFSIQIRYKRQNKKVTLAIHLSKN